jgi:hypothetical protein
MVNKFLIAIALRRTECSFPRVAKKPSNFNLTNRIVKIFVAIAVASCVLSCAQQTAVDLEREKQSLLELYHGDREAHFNTSATALFESSLDTFTSVSNAEIMTSLRRDRINFFNNVFKGATYSKWDNTQEPIIRISDDASMAWMINRIEVRRTKENEDGTIASEGFIYAGITTFKKVNGRWMKEANVSTFKPL